jgi:cathepsin E
MSPAPFNEFKFDGVLGLALEGLALHPEFSFFGQAIQQHSRTMEPRFGVYLAGDDGRSGSEITLGGYNAKRMSGELRWADVVEPEQGHWMLPIRSVRISGSGTEEKLDLCKAGGCRAIADTGTSLLGVRLLVTTSSLIAVSKLAQILSSMLAA